MSVLSFACHRNVTVLECHRFAMPPFRNAIVWCIRQRPYATWSTLSDCISLVSFCVLLQDSCIILFRLKSGILTRKFVNDVYRSCLLDVYSMLWTFMRCSRCSVRCSVGCCTVLVQVVAICSVLQGLQTDKDLVAI